MASTLKPTLKLHHPAYPHSLHLYPRRRPRLCLSISTIHARILTLSLSHQNVSLEQNKTNKAIGSLCQGFNFFPSDLDFSFCDDSGSESQPSPDIAVYPPGVEQKSPCDWTSIDMFIGWRVDMERDGYGKSFTYVLCIKNVYDHRDHRKTLKLSGQFFNFAGRIMDSQHRLLISTAITLGCIVLTRLVLSSRSLSPTMKILGQPTTFCDMLSNVASILLFCSQALWKRTYSMFLSIEYLDRAERATSEETCQRGRGGENAGKWSRWPCSLVFGL